MSDYLLPCGCVAVAVIADADHVCTEPTRPVEVDLSTAAAWVVTLTADPVLTEAARQALTLWALLTGHDDDHDAALALAHRIVALPDPLHAYTPTL